MYMYRTQKQKTFEETLHEKTRRSSGTYIWSIDFIISLFPESFVSKGKIFLVHRKEQSRFGICIFSKKKKK